MDILSFIWEAYSRLVYNLPVYVFSFLLRANLLLICPLVAAYIGFSQGIRNQKIQIILMVIGLLLGLSIKLDRALSPSPLRPWVTIILVLGLWFGPVPLSFLAHPSKGVQVKVIKYTRITLITLFILNGFIWR